MGIQGVLKGHSRGHSRGNKENCENLGYNKKVPTFEITLKHWGF
jgi:hypothetical protein